MLLVHDNLVLNLDKVEVIQIDLNLHGIIFCFAQNKKRIGFNSKEETLSAYKKIMKDFVSSKSICEINK